MLGDKLNKELPDWDHVFNFQIAKIAQTGLKLDIQKLFYTKSSTQNPMS